LSAIHLDLLRVNNAFTWVRYFSQHERCMSQARLSSMNRRIRCDTVLRAIESRSSDPNLNAIAVAKMLGITPRYVHLLLEDTGKSFTHHVLARRLERAAALLRDPRWRHRRIAEIAAEAGFADLSYFNRAFRRRYGATPSAVREQG
jgi:AraC-like DNA-binding protein